MTVYVNGQAGTPAASPAMATNSADILLGHSAWSSSDPYRYFGGKIDEVRIYSRALTADESAGGWPRPMLQRPEFPRCIVSLEVEAGIIQRLNSHQRFRGNRIRRDRRGSLLPAAANLSLRFRAHGQAIIKLDAQFASNCSQRRKRGAARLTRLRCLACWWRC